MEIKYKKYVCPLCNKTVIAQNYFHTTLLGVSFLQEG